MIIQLREAHTDEIVAAEIVRLDRRDMPLKKEGWQFNWRELYRNFAPQGGEFHGIYLEQDDELQGLILILVSEEGALVMKNIEVAPHNFGHTGQYKRVAGCLMAYACQESLEKGIGNYNGFLSFESKTKLIALYRDKYGASEAFGHRMFFSPKVGRQLVSTYLNRKL